MKNSFVLYYDLKDSFDMLTDEEAGRLIKAVFDYELTGELTDFEDRMLKATFLRITRCLDLNKEKYEQTCKKNKKVAQKRWEKVRQTKEIPESTTGTKGIQEAPENADTDNDTDTVTVTDTDTDTDNDIDNVYVYVNENDNDISSASQKNTHINNNNKTINHSDNKSIKESTKDMNTFTLGKFFNITLTFDELVSLKDKFPMSWDRRIEELSSYMESSGKTYNNCYAKLLEWKFFDKGKSEEELQKDKDREKRKSNAFSMTEDEPSYDIDMWNKKGLSLLP